MKETAELMKAIATLLWPIFAFVALYIFKPQIAVLLGRLKKGKIFGQDFELTDSLNKLTKSTVELEKETAALPILETTHEEFETYNVVKEILSETAHSPKTALILLASYLERDARQLLASMGHLKGQQNIPLSKAIEVLDKQVCGLPGHVPSSLKFFSEARNKLIHGGEASPEDILRAIDSGITILRALRAIPKEVNVVYHPGVDIFIDPLCKTLITNAKGIILETESPGGITKSFRIFPTTRAHFQKGKRVAWEWSFELTWGPTWYKDPNTHEIKKAWDSSTEFIGRHLDEV